MKVGIDMNLSPEWVSALKRHGFDAVHWSDTGNPTAVDTEILDWARRHSLVVFTNDLDFGRLLALTNSRGPSVLQIRGGALLPEDAESLVIAALEQCRKDLLAGALVTIDEHSRRVRVLPIR